MAQVTLPTVKAFARESNFSCYEPTKFHFKEKKQKTLLATITGLDWCQKFICPASPLEAVGTNSIHKDERFKLDAKFYFQKKVLMDIVSLIPHPSGQPPNQYPYPLYPSTLYSRISKLRSCKVVGALPWPLGYDSVK